MAHARKMRTRTAHAARQAPTRGRKVRKKEERSGKPAVNSQLSYRRNEIEKKRIRKKEKPAVNARLSYRRNEVEGKKMKNRYQITKKSTNQLSELISCTDPTKLPHIVCKKMHIILSFELHKKPLLHKQNFAEPTALAGSHHRSRVHTTASSAALRPRSLQRLFL